MDPRILIARTEQKEELERQRYLRAERWFEDEARVQLQCDANLRNYERGGSVCDRIPRAQLPLFNSSKAGEPRPRIDDLWKSNPVPHKVHDPDPIDGYDDGWTIDGRVENEYVESSGAGMDTSTGRESFPTNNAGTFGVWDDLSLTTADGSGEVSSGSGSSATGSDGDLGTSGVRDDLSLTTAGTKRKPCDESSWNNVAQREGKCSKLNVGRKR
ncbi:hypothetical protein ACHAWF_009995 [Thalassiosira exigua]